MKVALIDYDRGNLRSVEKALERVGGAAVQVERVEDAEKWERVEPDWVVLPGVGAYGDAMINLKERGLIEPIRRWLADNRPFLGICLGFQLLFESSEESPGVEGFGFFRGRVVRFLSEVGDVPHMGWNRVYGEGCLGDVQQVLADAPYFYHVHSYYPEVEADADWKVETEYGRRFCSGLGRGRVAAFQFHPEKSQKSGLSLLSALAAQAGCVSK